MYPPVRGVLRVTEGRVIDLHRLCRVAELVGEKSMQPIEGVPALYDATLLLSDGYTMTITGFERVWSAGRTIDYAQTWLVSPVEIGA